jgi:hypothetical protein
VLRNELYSTARFKGKTLPERSFDYYYYCLFVASLYPLYKYTNCAGPICYRSPKISLSLSTSLVILFLKKGGFTTARFRFSHFLLPQQIPSHPALRSQREGKPETHVKWGKKKRFSRTVNLGRFFNDHLLRLRRAHNNFPVSRSRLNNKQIIVFILV